MAAEGGRREGGDERGAAAHENDLEACFSRGGAKSISTSSSPSPSDESAAPIECAARRIVAPTKVPAAAAAAGRDCVAAGLVLREPAREEPADDDGSDDGAPRKDPGSQKAPPRFAAAAAAAPIITSSPSQTARCDTVSPTAGTAPDAAAAAAAPARMPPAANARAASLSGAVAAETAAANGLRAGAGAADDDDAAAMWAHEKDFGGIPGWAAVAVPGSAPRWAVATPGCDARLRHEYPPGLVEPRRSPDPLTVEGALFSHAEAPTAEREARSAASTSRMLCGGGR